MKSSVIILNDIEEQNWSDIDEKLKIVFKNQEIEIIFIVKDKEKAKALAKIRENKVVLVTTNATEKEMLKCGVELASGQNIFLLNNVNINFKVVEDALNEEKKNWILINEEKLSNWNRFLTRIGLINVKNIFVKAIMVSKEEKQGFINYLMAENNVIGYFDKVINCHEQEKNFIEKNWNKEKLLILVLIIFNVLFNVLFNVKEIGSLIVLFCFYNLWNKKEEELKERRIILKKENFEDSLL